MNRYSLCLLRNNIKTSEELEERARLSLIAVLLLLHVREGFQQFVFLIIPQAIKGDGISVASGIEHIIHASFKFKFALVFPFEALVTNLAGVKRKLQSSYVSVVNVRFKIVLHFAPQFHLTNAEYNVVSHYLHEDD